MLVALTACTAALALGDVTRLEEEPAGSPQPVSIAPPDDEEVRATLERFADLLPTGSIEMMMTPGPGEREVAAGLLARVADAARICEGAALIPAFAAHEEGPFLLSTTGRDISLLWVGVNTRERASELGAPLGLEVVWLPRRKGERPIWLGEARPSPESLRNARLRLTRPLLLLADEATGVFLATTNAEAWNAAVGKLTGEAPFPLPAPPTPDPPRRAALFSPAPAGQPIAFHVDLAMMLEGINDRETVAAGFSPTVSWKPWWQEISGYARLSERVLEIDFAATPTPGSLLSDTFLGQQEKHAFWRYVPAGAPFILSANLTSVEDLFDAWLQVLGQGDAAAIKASEEEADSFFGFPIRGSLLARLGPQCLLAARRNTEQQVEWILFADASNTDSIDRLLQHASVRFNAEIESVEIGDGVFRNASFQESGHHFAWYAWMDKLLAIAGSGAVSGEDLLYDRQGTATAIPPSLLEDGPHALVLYADLDATRDLFRTPESNQTDFLRGRDLDLPTVWLTMDAEAGRNTGRLLVEGRLWLFIERAIPEYSLEPRLGNR
ncbi:MAG: hypothetical protein PWP23_1685 [Candidatus Sumerlaeota bacterium]|nr:hypothetical protein [Candidatus Sumerlaeota bacterium]